MRQKLFMRRKLFRVALIADIVIVGCILVIGARIWQVGGLNGQRAQLHQCVLATQQSHPNEDARSRMAHLDAEVPECMERAGYEKALDNNDCVLSVWQGDVYCYLPKSAVGKLIYKIETFVGRII